EYAVNDAAIKALARDLIVFQRGYKLVTIIREPQETKREGIVRPAGAPRIIELMPPALRERLTCVARFVGHDARQDAVVPKHPPGWCAPAVAARGQWEGIRRLEGVVDAPVLRPDGTILRKAGYDPATGIIFEPTIDVPQIPDVPTKKQVDDARDL